VSTTSSSSGAYRRPPVQSAAKVIPNEEEGIVRREERRRSNEQIASKARPRVDDQGLVEFVCECTREDCERIVKAPLYVYQRLLEADGQYLLQAGHHAFPHYRTIVTLGQMRIEESA
jgi:hypothetical protein